MSDSERSINRRSVLKGGIGLGATAVIGGFGLAAFTGSGVAVSEFKINGDGSTFELNDGQVTAVVVDAYGTLTWDGLDHDATTATVTLDAKNKDGDWKQAAQQEIDLPSKNRKSGSQAFDFEPVDLTTLDGLGDDYFSAGGDGDTQERAIGLRITVEVATTKEGYTVSDSRGATLDTRVLNQPKETAGTAGADTYDAYAGPIYEQQETKTDQEAYLYIRYGEDKIIMDMDLRNYEPLVAEGAPLNAAIGLDKDEDNVADYQFGWLPGLDGKPTFAVKEGSLSGWSQWKDASSHDAVTATDYENGIVTFELDRSELKIESGDTYLTGFYASAGGEEEYVAVSDDPPAFWSSENSSTSSEHFIQVVAE